MVETLTLLGLRGRAAKRFVRLLHKPPNFSSDPPRSEVRIRLQRNPHGMSFEKRSSPSLL
jgi:hypothetical protein